MRPEDSNRQSYWTFAPECRCFQKRSKIFFYIIEFACPLDTRVDEEGEEKRERYKQKKSKTKRIWNYQKVGSVPIKFPELGIELDNFFRLVESIRSTSECACVVKGQFASHSRINRKGIECLKLRDVAWHSVNNNNNNIFCNPGKVTE